MMQKKENLFISLYLKFGAKRFRNHGEIQHFSCGYGKIANGYGNVSNGYAL
jgi:hypothetical protein